MISPIFLFIAAFWPKNTKKINERGKVGLPWIWLKYLGFLVKLWKI